MEFDFVKPIRDLPLLTEEKPEFLFEVIETLLPTALCSSKGDTPNQLLQLWSSPGTKRSSWTFVEYEY